MRANESPKQAIPHPGLIAVLLSAMVLASGACAPVEEDPPGADLRATDVDLDGEWVRAGHPQAWFVTFEGPDRVVFDHASLGLSVAATYAEAGADIDVVLGTPSRWLPNRMTLRLVEQGEDWVRLVDGDGEPWHLVRYEPLPEDLRGRWLTLPQNDPDYFVEFTAPNDILWRRKFGMRRSEDRVWRGWMRGDSLFLHGWNALPMHYLYEITGDTLFFERPGIGPSGRHVKAR